MFEKFDIEVLCINVHATINFAFRIDLFSDLCILALMTHQPDEIKTKRTVKPGLN